MGEDIISSAKSILIRQGYQKMRWEENIKQRKEGEYIGQERDHKQGRVAREWKNGERRGGKGSGG
jgi:hypothetical protein